MKNIIFTTITLLTLFLTSCDLEKEIDITLPDYEGRIFLECYLEPGQPFSLLLTRTAPYFDAFPADTAFLNSILVDSASVTIRLNDEEFTLTNNLAFNPFTGKIFNYGTFDFVPENYDDIFELEVVLKDGKRITGQTQILRPLELDSSRVEFASYDTLARVFVYASDPEPEKRNYYRRMIHHNSLDSIPLFDFPFDDRAVEDILIFGSPFIFAEGDTVFHSIYSIDKDYFDFLQTIQFAISANGNPFGQPSPISTNLKGDADAFGIFTGLSYVRSMTVVE